MFELLKGLVLRFADIPPEPHPPAGSPGSIRIFRAAPNYWNYLLVTWGARQALGAVAIAVLLSTGPVAQTAVVHGLRIAAMAIFLAQLPLSLAAARLNYEMRWYIVTDRSLRLREGIFAVREMTLTYANVQNIAIRQGPVQRLLGIADVVVRTAGGGGDGDGRGHDARALGASMHSGTLRAVDSAPQVRDLILERLRRLRDAGLGDPDERRHRPPSDATALCLAARELLEEARALRAAAR